MKKVRYGGDYSPEQWPPEVLSEDVKLMQEAGVDLVTVGVFSWVLLEPAEGRYAFGWLREVLDKLAAAGIGVDLATPTAAPPAWMSVRYPEVLPIDAAGARYSHGSRQAICICSPIYREKAAAITERLAETVGAHEAVEMWHVHNEYACHVPYCYCENHARSFRNWLTTSYGSLRAINEAWGTTFWGQVYSDLAEVAPPRMTAAPVNPGLELDYRRFCSQAFLDEFRMERDLLKAARPDLPVTTNLMGLFKPIDSFAWADEVDIVSTDIYTDPARAEWPVESALQYDLTRGLNKGRPWMVMEQTTSRVNWRARNVAKRPGHMRSMSYQAVARGAIGVLFFQWRASKTGAEKFHSAMLPHSGKRSPTWSEVSGLGKELEVLGDLACSRVDAQVAIIFSWPSWWAMEGTGQPVTELTLETQLFWLYRSLYEQGVVVDFCRPEEDLSRYRTVLLPSLYLLSEGQAANILGYVERGGTALVSFWSGIVDEQDSVYLGPYGGPLRPLIGGDVLDVSPLRGSEVVDVAWEDGSTGQADFWADVIAEGEGRVLARFTTGDLSGRPAVLETSYGRGRSYYVGCRLDGPTLTDLFGRILALRPRRHAGAPVPALERVLRVGDCERYEFIINHSTNRHDVEIPAGSTDLLTGKQLGSRVRLEPSDVLVLRHPVER